MTMATKPFAVFLVAKCNDSFVAATTRPGGSIGLPGGKIDVGEHPEAALRRECREEGWDLHPAAVLDHIIDQQVDGKLVRWFGTTTIPKASNGDHKEAARGIMPTPLHISKVNDTGMGNSHPSIAKYINNF